MSYYAANDGGEDNLYQEDAVERRRSPRDTTSSPRSSRRSKDKPRSKRSIKTDVEEYQENNAVGNYADPDEDEEERRKSRRSTSSRRSKSRSKSRTGAADEDATANSSKKKLRAVDSGEKMEGLGLFGRPKRKSSKRKNKSRQERLYDDLYGATNYQEVDDGIVGCADDLCVNKADVFENDEEGQKKQQQSSSQQDQNTKQSSFFGGGPNTGAQNKNVDESEEVYIVKQRFGYFSIIFGVVQVIVLALMMWQCGIAPMNINPMFGPYPDALSEWGGKNSILIVEDGEWWRLFTPILLHAGLIHLFCNVAVQLELGVFFEREWGSLTWLIIYLTSALGSSVLSVITMPDAVSVGSSGAVMGLFGGKIAEVACRCCEKSDTAQERVAHQVRKEQCMGVTCSVLVVLAFSFIPYVDWAAHLGGLMAGLFVGFMCFSIHMESYCLRLVWFLVGMGLTLGFFIPCIDIMYSGNVPINEELRDVCGYYTQNFQDYECNCMREEYMENLKNGNFWNNDDGGGGERMLMQVS
ncbi:RHOMBOID-like [Seminavis robusta]|uniref:rhomboid protease n=1 Tax=Seminavis robusta TaxID=568900 RepID=A0A9N8EBT8_9STRA|nr:RHOMBOID-like [Seminavis robusta]|eukprot:Sro855_g211430.1 RHOMBOID-like (524) ;mRNA; r:26762-28425